MRRFILISTALLVSFWKCEINAVKLPGPLVYVVTPSPRPPQIDKSRAAPFYYHNWMRRMDTPWNVTTSTITTTAKTKTPDLIFAEFESGNTDNMKSIRKLLEREKIEPKTTSTTTTTTTTLQPIYVPDDDVTRVVNYGLPVMSEDTTEKQSSEADDYFSMYNQLYNNVPVPVYLPSTRSTSTTVSIAPTSTTTTTTTAAPINVENIWHIIDNEKYNQYSGNWEEQPLPIDKTEEKTTIVKSQDETLNIYDDKVEDEQSIDENFAVPGFGTKPGNGAENESRAIRTEPNMRFPYVNLKPFVMKSPKKPLLDTVSNSKKNNMFTSLDNFHEIKNPVRGEAQDVVSMRQPIDRYNPAQPYLPQPNYGGNSKQSSGNAGPVRTVANLVPPPPPPVPKITDSDFPSPTSYESFPPYSPPVSNPMPAAPAVPKLTDSDFPSPTSYEPFPPYSPAASKPRPVAPAPSPPPASKPIITMYQPPIDSTDYSGPDSSDSDGQPPDSGYQYKQPPSQFLPTLPPLKKPFGGYSYDKPSMTLDSPPPMDSGDTPDFQGYHYSKPAPPPSPPAESAPPSYGPSYHHDNDYPELVYDNHHGGVSDTKGGDMKGTDMVPPPPPPPEMTHDHGPPMDSGPPMDDHGFPHDFPGDLKFHHDFDDDDYHHHHHHTTTTSTTEQPRVNRYSYYYLGKKLYYLPLYFSVYFIIYVGALIIKAVLRHKIVYPNSWRPNDTTASFFSKRSIDSWDLSKDNLHEITGRVTHAIATAAEKYVNEKKTE